MSYRKNRRLEDSYTLKPLSRRSILDKQRALAGAHNEAETKLGNLILRGPVTDPIYEREVSKIEQDGQRLQTDMAIRKKQLMKRLTLLPEPTVIIRRSLKSRESSSKEPSLTPAALTTSLPSLDAFTVKGRKKRNVWERKLLTPPNLLSIHVPCQPLSDAEEREIYLRNALLLPRPGTKGSRHSKLRTRLSQPVTKSMEVGSSLSTALGTGLGTASGNVLFRDPISAHANMKSLQRLKSKTPRAESNVFVTDAAAPGSVLSCSDKTLRRVQFDDDTDVESVEQEPKESPKASHHPVIVVVRQDTPEVAKPALDLGPSGKSKSGNDSKDEVLIPGKAVPDELMVKGPAQ